jgi:hypothetical protein
MGKEGIDSPNHRPHSPFVSRNQADSAQDRLVATGSWAGSNRSLRSSRSIVHSCVFQRDSRPYRRFLKTAWPCILLCFAILTSQTRTFATADWQYKVGQFVSIENGLSPNQAYTVAAHEDERGSFGIFLVNARTKKNLGPLQQVAEFFDTAPAAFHAEWAPDSRHLAIWYRVHRHLNRLAIYRVENDRAYSITGPSLLLRVSPELATAESRIDVAFHSLKWQTSSRFLLHEEGIIRHVSARILQALGSFGQLDTASAQPAAVPSANYAIDATCELAPDDRYRILTVTPAKTNR